jgi:hypothetical protein
VSLDGNYTEKNKTKTNFIVAGIIQCYQLLIGKLLSGT